MARAYWGVPGPGAGAAYAGAYAGAAGLIMELQEQQCGWELHLLHGGSNKMLCACSSAVGMLVPCCSQLANLSRWPVIELRHPLTSFCHLTPPLAHLHAPPPPPVPLYLGACHHRRQPGYPAGPARRHCVCQRHQRRHGGRGGEALPGGGGGRQRGALRGAQV